MVFTPGFTTGVEFARSLDASDPLRRFRDAFFLPQGPAGKPSIYLCGHSLGLQPRRARDQVLAELDRWAHLAVDGHFHGDSPWYHYQERLRGPAARLVGARPDEVVFMNGLTVNLHLLLATFYRPDSGRHRILLDEPTFPSDRFAVITHLRHHGYTPEQALVTVGPRTGETLLRMEDVEECLERQGPRIAVVLLSPVNFLTGQWLDIPRLTTAAHRQGCLVGLDLAHAAGNVPLELHAWDVDFAVWCTYKYLNSGPGAVAGCFVHERHGRNLDLPRLAGWWGNDPATRFRMQLDPNFVPHHGADGWQVSNPPVLALASIQASLELFDEATMPALRARSEHLTGYLIDLIDTLPEGYCELLTPRDPAARGAQVSLRIPDRPREAQAALRAAGVVCDFREPDVIRGTPVPLYNTFEEVWEFAQVLAGRPASGLTKKV